MNSVVYSPCYGGYGLSEKGKKLFEEISGKKFMDTYDESTPRHHPALIKVVKILGKEASSNYADLQIIDIPGFQYRISEYDGYESVKCPENATDWVEINNKYSREKWPEYFI